MDIVQKDIAAQGGHANPDDLPVPLGHQHDGVSPRDAMVPGLGCLVAKPVFDFGRIFQMICNAEFDN